MERALMKLQQRAAATPGARAIGVVRLFGLVHADERTAFKARRRPSHARHSRCTCCWRTSEQNPHPILKRRLVVCGPACAVAQLSPQP